MWCGIVCSLADIFVATPIHVDDGRRHVILLGVPVPILVIWGAVFWKRMRRYFTRWGETWSNLTDRTSEALSGIRVVKAFAQEQREIREFEKVNAKISEIGIKTSVNRTVFFATISFLTGFGVLVVWYFGGQQVISGELTLAPSNPER